MVGNLRLRFGLALALAALSAAAVATPAAAETVLSSCHGTCGAYTAYDDDLANQGARCVYNRSADSFGDHLINSIVARPPQMNGSHAAMTPVAWRFSVQRWRHGLEDSGYKSIVYTSSWQTAQANTTSTAYLGSGFTWRTWSFTQDPNHAVFDAYRVIVEMCWSFHGSVEGKEKIRYDWYRIKMGSDVRVQPTWCGGAFPD